jgi:hypothetical protein
MQISGSGEPLILADWMISGKLAEMDEAFPQALEETVETLRLESALVRRRWDTSVLSKRTVQYLKICSP